MDPFVGEIRAVGFNYAPRNWALCDGSLVQIRSFTALYAILGTQFGGDGRTTFGLPDLRGRVVVNAGQGPGLSRYLAGQRGGTESETLSLANLPPHTHDMSSLLVSVNTAAASEASPAGNLLGANSKAHYNSDSNVQMADGMVTGSLLPVGGSGPHTNIMPVLALNYIIALTGVFPPRS